MQQLCLGFPPPDSCLALQLSASPHHASPPASSLPFQGNKESHRLTVQCPCIRSSAPAPALYPLHQGGFTISILRELRPRPISGILPRNSVFKQLGPAPYNPLLLPLLLSWATSYLSTGLHPPDPSLSHSGSPILLQHLASLLAEKSPLQSSQPF